MLAVTIDNFPPALHAKLQEVAKGNHCSVTEQILTVLEQYLTTPLSSALVTQPLAIQPRLDKRQVGEYVGQIFLSDDFDAPLPDEYWLGESEK